MMPPSPTDSARRNSSSPSILERVQANTRSYWPEWITLAAYSALVAFAIPYHEPWADEAQAWQLARSLSLRSLFQTYIRYEGSPGLWHFLLWILTRAHVSYGGLHWFCGAIGVAATALLVFKSPFPRYLRLSFPFTFFLLFQYAVVARSYVLVPILLYLIAFSWKKSPVFLALLLGLLANVALHAAMISGGLALVYALLCMQARMPCVDVSPRRKLLALATLVSLYTIAVFTAWPPPDQGFKTATAPPVIALAINFIELCGPWGMAIPFWIFVSLLLRARSASIYLLPFLLFVSFSLAVHVYIWHSGLLVPLAISILWITWPAPNHVGSKLESVGRSGLVGIIALQICWAAYALEFDHYHAYSPDQAAAEFLRPFARAGSSIAVTYLDDSVCQACRSVGLMPYFEQSPFINEPEPFWSWSTHNPAENLFQQLLPTKPEIVVVEAGDVHSNRPIDLQNAKVSQVIASGYVFTHVFCGEMPEGFSLKKKSCHLIFQRVDREQEPSPK